MVVQLCNRDRLCSKASC